MKLVTPEVYFIGPSTLDEQELTRYLKAVGAPEWATNAPSDAEKLVEAAGRACYRSWKPGLNPNVKKVREGNDTYLAHILNVGHGSVLEHVTLNFIFHNVSRVFTHELARHRVGTAISQESLRYVRLDELGMWLPHCIRRDEWAAAKFAEVFLYLESVQRELAEHFKIDEMNSMNEKKELTSAFRRLAPEGLATSTFWSGNIRTIRHLIEMRTDPPAEEEIRLVFGTAAAIVKERFPNFFDDYEVEMVNDLPHYKTPHRKV